MDLSIKFIRFNKNISTMGFYADDVAEFAKKNEKGRKLGDLLVGRFSKLDVEGVKGVRKLRNK